MQGHPLQDRALPHRTRELTQDVAEAAARASRRPAGKADAFAAGSPAGDQGTPRAHGPHHTERGPRTRRAHGHILVSTLLVATSFPVVESIAGDLDSAVLAVVRFALAALLFLPLVVARHGRRVLPTWRSLVRYALLSAPLVGFFFGMFEALRTTTAVHTAALFTFAPAFAAVFSLLLLHERFSLRRVLGLGLGMLGASWVALGGDPERLVALHFVAGDAIFLAATASLGLYGALVKRLHRGEPLEIMTFWTLVTGTAWLLLLGHDPLAHVPWTAFEPRVLVAVGYLALFTTLITFLLTQSATLVIGPTRALSYTYLNPILVAVLAWTLGADALGLAALPGVGLTFASMVVLQTDGWRGETAASINPRT